MTVAGVDSGGGAGIAADLKSFAAFGVHGTCAVTALTAQNTQGVNATELVPLEMIEAQIRAVVDDFGCQAVKTGMLATAEIANRVYEVLREVRIRHIVIDPVMVATSGAVLLEPEAERVYTQSLIPAATVITPNVPEAEAFLGHKIHSLEDMATAARELGKMGCKAVILTGGHLVEQGQAADVVWDRKSDRCRFLMEPAINTGTTHGSGCTHSAAVAACLAQGDSILEAATRAKQFTIAALRRGLDIGGGAGPVNPMSTIWLKEGEK
jgi:hydroxymethylpyrimidine/phosphomethylpyrimidine kinase